MMAMPICDNMVCDKLLVKSQGAANNTKAKPNQTP
jgi:hypothetical protein